MGEMTGGWANMTDDTDFNVTHMDQKADKCIRKTDQQKVVPTTNVRKRRAH